VGGVEGVVGVGEGDGGVGRVKKLEMMRTEEEMYKRYSET
jgi:hypothetical protein